MPLKKSEIHKILVISLTNIGDVILTFPVIDILKRDFPAAELSVVVGPKAKDLFCENPHLKHVHVFEKSQHFVETARWVWALRQERFDLVVDLRNTAIPFLIGGRYKTSFVDQKKKNGHMKQKHLDRLNTVWPFSAESDKDYALHINEADKKLVQDLLNKELSIAKDYVVVAPGSAFHAKRWSPEGYGEVCDGIWKKYQKQIVFVGNKQDDDVVKNICSMMNHKAVNLCGKTTLLQSAEVLRNGLVVIANDSAVMHLASKLNMPVIAIFCSTDPAAYGPWSSKSIVLQSEKECPACQDAKNHKQHACMNHVKSQDVLNAFDIKNNEVIFNP